MSKLFKSRSRLKIIRRFLDEFPILTNKKVSKKKLKKPGQHFDFTSIKTDVVFNFKRKFYEKQKLKAYFAFSESSLKRCVKKAYQRSKPNFSSGTILNNFVDILKLRLDFIIVSLNFVPTILAARQLINHGYVKVNGKVIFNINFECNIGDYISTDFKQVLKRVIFQHKNIDSYLRREIDLINSCVIGKVLMKPSTLENLYTVSNLVVGDEESKNSSMAFYYEKIKSENLQSSEDLNSFSHSIKNNVHNTKNIINNSQSNVNGFNDTNIIDNSNEVIVEDISDSKVIVKKTYLKGFNNEDDLMFNVGLLDVLEFYRY